MQSTAASEIIRLISLLLTNNCYKVALSTPIHAWHGHVAPRHIN